MLSGSLILGYTPLNYTRGDSALHKFDQLSRGIIRPCTDEVRDFDHGERNAANVEAQAKRVAAAWPTWAWGKKP